MIEADKKTLDKLAKERIKENKTDKPILNWADLVERAGNRNNIYYGDYQIGRDDVERAVFLGRLSGERIGEERERLRCRKEIKERKTFWNRRLEENTISSKRFEEKFGIRTEEQDKGIKQMVSLILSELDDIEKRLLEQQKDDK